MEEATAGKVMEEYLKAKHYDPGPLLHMAGKAYEANGSASYSADTLDQLLGYAYSGKYTIYAVFPVAFLASAYELQVFHLFCRIL